MNKPGNVKRLIRNLRKKNNERLYFNRVNDHVTDGTKSKISEIPPNTNHHPGKK